MRIILLPNYFFKPTIFNILINILIIKYLIDILMINKTVWVK